MTFHRLNACRIASSRSGMDVSKDRGNGMKSEYIDLSWSQLALASALVLADAVISWLVRLGLERRLISAAIRMVLQLLLIGVVLRWVFGLKQWYAVVPLVIIMSLIGSLGAVEQTSRRYPGI